jgi:hypothetical protein
MFSARANILSGSVHGTPLEHGRRDRLARFPARTADLADARAEELGRNADLLTPPFMR